MDRPLSTLSLIFRAGAHHRTNTDANVQDIKVSKVITHPSYHQPTTYSNDIALLKLEQSAALNKLVFHLKVPMKWKIIWA